MKIVICAALIAVVSMSQAFVGGKTAEKAAGITQARIAAIEAAGR